MNFREKNTRKSTNILQNNSKKHSSSSGTVGSIGIEDTEKREKPTPGR